MIVPSQGHANHLRALVLCNQVAVVPISGVLGCPFMTLSTSLKSRFLRPSVPVFEIIGQIYGV